MTRQYTKEQMANWNDSFENMVDSTSFFVQYPHNRDCECHVPLFNKAEVTFKPSHSSAQSSQHPPDICLLEVKGEISREDFGWVCTKFHECKDSFTGLDHSNLDEEVMQHFEHIPPNTGFHASERSDENLMETLFKNEYSMISQIQEKGYYVFDTNLKTSSYTNAKLSSVLTEKTGQHESIRSDAVKYLTQDGAEECGAINEYNLLMAVASYLNEHLEFEPSEYDPVFPGTEQNPLTNPGVIQAAEYSEGEFYAAHSDNSLSKSGIRNNFRHFTCILYCNEGWKEEYGGALRIYPGSQNLRNPDDAKILCPYEDIVPVNGRLLIFHSSLVHSVEKVLVKNRVRQALTLWMKRPEDRRG